MRENFSTRLRFEVVQFEIDNTNGKINKTADYLQLQQDATILPKITIETAYIKTNLHHQCPLM